MDVSAANPPAAIRFCPSCGAPADPLSPDCAACAARAAQPPPVREFHSLPALRSLRSTLILYFLLLGVCIVGTSIYIADAPLSARDEVRLDINMAFAISGTTLVFCLFAWRSMLPPLLRLGDLRWYVIAPLAAVATFLVASLIVSSANQFFGLEEVSYLAPFIEAGTPTWLPLVLVCIQPAVFEELAFRGYIGTALQRVLTQREALLVTAFLFAILHLSPIAFVHLAILGLTLGYIRARSGSLYPCMLLHFSHNALALLCESLARSPYT